MMGTVRVPSSPQSLGPCYCLSDEIVASSERLCSIPEAHAHVNVFMADFS